MTAARGNHRRAVCRGAGTDKDAAGKHSLSCKRGEYRRVRAAEPDPNSPTGWGERVGEAGHLLASGSGHWWSHRTTANGRSLTRTPCWEEAALTDGIRIGLADPRFGADRLWRAAWVHSAMWINIGAYVGEGTRLTHA